MRKLVHLVIIVSIIGALQIASNAGITKDRMRQYIPEEIKAGYRMANVRGGSFDIGWQASVYKLSDHTLKSISSNPNLLSDWNTKNENCLYTMMYLRDLAPSKYRKIKKFYETKQTSYGKKRAMLVPNDGIIIICETKG